MKRCRKGSVRNAKTKRCRKVQKTKRCKKGTRRSRKTHRCRKI